MKHLGTYGIGPVTLIVNRYPTMIEAVVYKDKTARTFNTPIAEDTDDTLALGWGIDLAVTQGATGDVLLLHAGCLPPSIVTDVVTASRTIRTAAQRKSNEQQD